ncbi:hypothetical protein [Tessaracoccus caeni]|uniref:hypothetical protein n=1 Tax=Tessaracoccus caeni TaxID=3031239 RepID=UPI0023DB6D6A|nr:hypothetical protein [Tessaracoccus caeni]
MTAAALLLFLSACSPPGDPGVHKDAVRRLEPSQPVSKPLSLDSEVPGEDPDFPTPFAPYMATVTESVTMEYAESLLMRDCLANFGFTHDVQSFSDRIAAAREREQLGITRLYGATDRDMAKKYGYYVEIKPRPERDHVGPEYELVVYGVRSLEEFDSELAFSATASPASVDGVEIPPGGCLGETWRRMGSVPEAGDSLARMLWFETADESRPAYREVVNEWVSCMAASGYKATGPLDLEPGDAAWEFRERDPLTPPSEKEVALVLADIDCKEQTDLVKRLSEISWAVEQESVEKNLLALQEDRVKVEQRVARALKEIEKLGGFE